MGSLILLALSCGIISASAEKNKNKVLTISNAVLFIFLSVFLTLGSENYYLVLACKNIIGNDGMYKIIHQSIVESSQLTTGVFSVYFLIQIIVVSLVAFVTIINSIKALKKIRKLFAKYIQRVRKDIEVSVIRSENIASTNETTYCPNYLYLSKGALLI